MTNPLLYLRKENEYNVMDAKEKQATPKVAFVFLASINEQTVCGADKKRESARLRVRRKNEQTVCGADKKRGSARLRVSRKNEVCRKAAFGGKLEESRNVSSASCFPYSGRLQGGTSRKQGGGATGYYIYQYGRRTGSLL